MAGFGNIQEHQSSGVSDNMINIYIHEILPNEDVTAVVATDGFSDCLYKYQIGQTISDIIYENKNIKAQDISHVLMEKARFEASRTEFGWGKTELSPYTNDVVINNNFSQHDDMSIAVLRCKPI